QTIERFAQGAALCLREAGSDLAGIAQAAGIVVIADQNGADPMLARRRLDEAADDEFLALSAFALQPIGPAARPIGCVDALGDDPLEPEAAGVLEESRSLAGEMVAVAQ